jgi:hypothetical protein
MPGYFVGFITSACRRRRSGTKVDNLCRSTIHFHRQRSGVPNPPTMARTGILNHVISSTVNAQFKEGHMDDSPRLGFPLHRAVYQSQAFPGQSRSLNHSCANHLTLHKREDTFTNSKRTKTRMRVHDRPYEARMWECKKPGSKRI